MEKKLESYASSKRSYYRIEKEKEYFSYQVLRKIFSLKENSNKINFSSINNFKNLFTYHILKNNISLINKTNFKVNDLKIKDFRQSTNYKRIINNEFNINNNNNNIDPNYIFYNLYFDSTNISKVKFKKKNIYNVYLNFNCIESNSKKFIYNICSVDEKLLKKINKNLFLEFLSNKLKNEVENGFFIKGKLVKAFCLFIIGDNKEQYDLLRLLQK
jgi:hypothetical protein